MRIRLPQMTLVELLVIIAIIGVLCALLIPAIQAARQHEQRRIDGDNEPQIQCQCNCGRTNGSRN